MFFVLCFTNIGFVQFFSFGPCKIDLHFCFRQTSGLCRDFLFGSPHVCTLCFALYSVLVCVMCALPHGLWFVTAIPWAPQFLHACVFLVLGKKSIVVDRGIKIK